MSNTLAVLLAGLSISVWADGRIQGYVSAAEQGVALQGAKIRIKELNREAVSQRDGRFVFLDIKPGTYTLVSNYLGADDLEQRVTIVDNKTQQINFLLKGVSGVVENITVIGQAAGINKALNKQRSADNIITAVSADAIGQLPDTNVSEALQRLPGISVERDQGEGRYVRVRGMGPDFNAVTINGVSVPGPDSDRRAVALDVIPSDLLENLVVTKSLTPDMDANSLGGSIDVQSLSAFDRDGLFYQLTAEGSFDENTEKSSPKLAVTASNRFSTGDNSDNLGIAAGISHFKREFGSDNVETGGNWNFDDGDVLLEEVEQRDYRITRERSGLTLNLDYKPDDNTQLYWRNLYSEYTDSEIRLSNVVEFKEVEDESEQGLAEVQRELKDRTETQKILSTSLGGKTDFDRWAIEYGVGYSKSGEEEPPHIAAAVFILNEDVIPDEELFLEYSGTRKIFLDAPAEYYQPDSYVLDEVELASSETNDESTSVNLDFTRELQLSERPVQLKFGAKHAQREKDNNIEIMTSEDFDGDTSLSQFVGTGVDYALGEFGSQIKSSAVKNVVGETEVDKVESIVGDFAVSEDTSAAYVMGHIDLGGMRLLSGVRYETTDFTARGFTYDSREEDEDEVNDGISPNLVTNDHDYWLPALHLRYRINDKTQVRAAWTNSVVRPSFGQLSPGMIIEEDGDEIETQLEAEFGNPALKPLESKNLDVGIEYYPRVASVLSVYLFHKSINHFIYQTDVAGTAGYEDFSEAMTFVNGSEAEVSGLELSASNQFSQLPAPWNGLLLGGNATWVDSSAEIGTYDDNEFSGREIPLPSQSDISANLMLGYESDKWSLRLSANYKSEYLLEVLESDEAEKDVYVDKQLHLDFSLRYFINENIKLHLEALNLTDEVYYAYVNTPAYNAQYESYGATYKIGLTFMSF